MKSLTETALAKDMQREEFYSVLKKHTPGYANLYALLDCAIDESIYPAIKSSGCNHHCLYRLDVGEELTSVSPHLVELQDSDFTQWLFQECWGKFRGYYIASNKPLADVVKHLRRITKAQMPDGKNLLFRFEDPRIMRAFLPSCNREQLERVMGDIGAFIIEDNTIVNEVIPDSATKYEVGYFGLINQVVPLSLAADIPQSPPPEVQLWAKPGQLKVSTAQRELFSSVVKEIAVKDTISDLRVNFAQELESIDHGTLRSHVDAVIPYFDELGLITTGEFQSLAELCVKLDWAFWQDPSYSWVNEEYFDNPLYQTPSKALEKLLVDISHGLGRAVQ